MELCSKWLWVEKIRYDIWIEIVGEAFLKVLYFHWNVRMWDSVAIMLSVSGWEKLLIGESKLWSCWFDEVNLESNVFLAIDKSLNWVIMKVQKFCVRVSLSDSDTGVVEWFQYRAVEWFQLCTVLLSDSSTTGFVSDSEDEGGSDFRVFQNNLFGFASVETSTLNMFALHHACINWRLFSSVGMHWIWINQWRGGNDMIVIVDKY